METASALITGIPGGIAAIIIAYATLKRTNISENNNRTLLRELWSWIEISDLTSHVPKRLRHDILQTLNNDDNEDDYYGI